MTLRSPRERIIQTLAYEVCALCLAVPFYALTADRAAGAAIGVMVAMMSAEMLWAPLHDTVFDFSDLKLSGRLASDRPKRWRVVHALSREVTTMVVTLPVLMWMGGHSFWQGFWLDVGLTLLYAGYGFFFYLGFDWLRPVVPSPKAALAKTADCYVLPPLARISTPARVTAPVERQSRATAYPSPSPSWAE